VVLERQLATKDRFFSVGRSSARIIGRVAVAVVKAEDRFITANHHRDDVSISSLSGRRFGLSSSTFCEDSSVNILW